MYTDITSWCLKEGPAFTPVLRQELSNISLSKLHSAFDDGLKPIFWGFMESVFEKMHWENQVSPYVPQ